MANPDPYRGFRSGDPVPRDAGTFNAFALGARMARDNGVGMSAGPQASSVIQGELIRIRNESGADLVRGSVLGLGDPVVLPADDLEAFQRGIVFRGVEPLGHAARFVVLLEPAPQDQVVRAWVAGVVQVKVDVTDSGHTCAEVQDGETGNLVSTNSGSAQILWREGGTGVQWAVIRFGGGCSQSSGTPYCFCIEAPPATLHYSVSITIPGYGFVGTHTGTLSYYSDTTGIDPCFADFVDCQGNPIPGWVGEYAYWYLIQGTGGIDSNPDDPQFIPFLFGPCYSPSDIPAGYQAITPGWCSWLVLLCSVPCGKTANVFGLRAYDDSTCGIGPLITFVTGDTSVNLSCSPFLLQAISPVGVLYITP